MISYLMIYGIVMVIFWEPRLEQVDGLSGCRRCTIFGFVFVLLTVAEPSILHWLKSDWPQQELVSTLRSSNNAKPIIRRKSRRTPMNQITRIDIHRTEPTKE